MILLFRGSTDPLGMAIRFRTWGKYMHAAYLCRSGEMIESIIWQGVINRPAPFKSLGGRLNDDERFDVFRLRNAKLSELIQIENFLRAQVGKKYDNAALVAFLMRWNSTNEDRWFCSELIASAFEDARRLLLMTETYKIDPSLMSWSTEIEMVAEQAGIDWYRDNFQQRS